MRRVLLPVSIVMIMMLGLLAVSRPGSTAQDDASTATSGDSFVGAWVIDTGLDIPSLGNLMADGNLIISNLPTEPVFEGADFEVLLLSPSHGVWEATGENTANLTFSYLYANERGEYQSMTTISSAVELGADGQTFSGEFTYQVTLADGTFVHADRGTVEATRINIIPMDDLLPAGTPAASPAA